MGHQSTALQKTNDNKILEQVITKGDLSSLTPEQKVSHYNAVCQSLGLNPLTRPFEYITLNNQLQLYARKDATEQLRKINGISIWKIETTVEDGCLIVTAYARTPEGREDIDEGVVYIKGKVGDSLANAQMKCFHPDTEVLTTRGWIDIPFVTPDDQVAQYDVETEIITFAYPLAIVETDTDNWIEIEDNLTRQCVTPTHDVVTGKTKHEAQILMELEANAGERWRSKDYPAPVPACGKVESSGLNEPNYVIKLLAAFMSDGSWTPSEKAITFGFHKERKAERLRDLLKEADWPFTESIYDLSANERFVNTVEKRTVFYVKLPAAWVFGQYLSAKKALHMSTILKMNNEQARLLVEEMQFWDGCLDDKKGIIFQQTDQSIADSFQALCVLHGIEISARIKEKGSNLPNAKPVVRMRMSQAVERPQRRMRRSYKFIPNDENLKAVCLTMPKGTLVTRFIDRVAISGNCITKAKRRATLSICGLGFLDESEIETIPNAQRPTNPEEDAVMTAGEADQLTLSYKANGLDQWTCGRALAMKLITVCKLLEAKGVDEETMRSRLPGGVQSRKDLTEEQAQEAIKAFNNWLNSYNEVVEGSVING